MRPAQCSGAAPPPHTRPRGSAARAAPAPRSAKPRSASRPSTRRLHVAGVQAALLERLLLPPPAPLALVLPGVDRPRARLAADREEAALVEGVVGHLMLADVGPHLLRRPVRERVELDERALGRPEGGIELYDGHLGPRARTLVPALARHPRFQRTERAHQRLHLPNAAALLVTILVEGEQ